MKRIIYLSLPLFLFLGLHGQSVRFKNIRKNQPGTTTPGFSFVTVKSGISLKSSSVGVQPFHQLTMPLSVREKIRVITDENMRTVFIERKNTLLKSGITDKEKFYTFFDETGSITGIVNPRENLKIENNQTDDLGITHIRSIQQFRGIEIYGSASVLHISSEKEWFTGRICAIKAEIQTIPEISPEAALTMVLADLKKVTLCRELSGPEEQFLQYTAPLSKLILFENQTKQYMLAYEIEIRPNFIEVWKYFVNASTGEIIRKFNNTPSDGPYTATAADLNGISRTIDTYLKQGVYYMVNASESMYNTATGEGIILTLDANNTSTTNLNYKEIVSADNKWNAPAAVSAHYHAARMFKYLKATFSRNSINGKGGNIISLVNVAEDDGSSLENAFWNGKAVFYGNGGTLFKPLAGGLDVGAHELGHGVVSNSANLEYFGQPGAINETYADIFGTMVDREDWLLGEDIVKTTKFPSGAMRNMKDPHNQGTASDHYWQPAHVSEMYLGSEDNSGVHINSGIGNHAYYLFAESVSKEKAEQIFYRALTQYLTKTSMFIDLRIAVIQAAKDLYPGTPDIALKAADAFDKVGIYQEQQVEEQQDYQINPGQEYLLCGNTDVFDPYTLYRSSAAGTDFRGLTRTALKGHVSVTDDGKFAYYVSADSKIRGLYLDSPYTETIVQSDPLWENVAISKDGKRLAAISNETDAAIYVYDFGLQKWQKFLLYNPTTSDDQSMAGGVLYADAIEFDHTGQYLMYDSFNALNSNTFEDISYWDIGFIKVWDNSTHNFGNGSISKLFGSLPEKVSIGNAVFSKNSADIIAFDYVNNATNEYAVLGANLETGDLEIIFQNLVLGFPSFSKDDGKMAFAAKSTSNKEVIGIIPLAKNKISPAGNASILIEDATRPVFYATGTRTLGLPPAANFSADIKSGKAPLTVRFLDLSVNTPTTWQWSFPGGNPSSSSLQNPVVIYNSNGIYPVSLTVTNANGNNTMTKSNYITVSPASGIEDLSTAPVRFYPNPVHNILHITAPVKNRLNLYDARGTRILECFDKVQIDFSNIPSGVYVLEVIFENRVFKNRIFKH